MFKSTRRVIDYLFDTKYVDTWSGRVSSIYLYVCIVMLSLNLEDVNSRGRDISAVRWGCMDGRYAYIIDFKLEDVNSRGRDKCPALRLDGRCIWFAVFETVSASLSKMGYFKLEDEDYSGTGYAPCFTAWSGPSRVSSEKPIKYWQRHSNTHVPKNTKVFAFAPKIGTRSKYHNPIIVPMYVRIKSCTQKVPSKAAKFFPSHDNIYI